MCKYKLHHTSALIQCQGVGAAYISKQLIIRDLGWPFRREPPARTLALHLAAPDARSMCHPRRIEAPARRLSQLSRPIRWQSLITLRPADFHGQIRSPRDADEPANDAKSMWRPQHDPPSATRIRQIFRTKNKANQHECGCPPALMRGVRPHDGHQMVRIIS